jgi:uncharacterized protein
MTSPVLLRGVDRAAFAVSFSEKLRRASVPVSLSRTESFTRALEQCAPRRLSRLYWVARTTLICDQRYLSVFDEVFAAVFNDAVLAIDPHARRKSSLHSGPDDDTFARVPGKGSEAQEDEGLPWATLPPSVAEATTHDELSVVLPERLPAHLEQVADVPFDELSAEDLALAGSWLEAAFEHWPTRRTRRAKPSPTGNRIALRRTLEAARRTGFEPINLVRQRAIDKPRRVVMICDVSQSMQTYASAYLHMMRAMVVAVEAEVFAFATGLTRLTPILAHKSADAAINQANSVVDDRFGGTRIATNIEAILKQHHGQAIRGAIVIVASDGWDSDPPEQMARAMARIRRRAHRVIWLNPRSAGDDYQPLVAGMAAALPYCDELLPGNTLNAMKQVIEVIAED